MKDIFEEKAIKPMLIGEMSEAFDSVDYVFELKLDGERCIAYLDPVYGTELRNKRNMKMLGKVPELSGIHRQVKRRCILDGELIVIVEGKPSFYEIQRRSLTSNKFKIQILASNHQASFIAFDILYFEDHETTSLPLMDRKKLLEQTVVENERLAISRYIDEHGTDFYKLTEQQDLEGIVAKQKESKYFFDKRTKDWIKIKNLKDEDFIICGYINKENNVVSIVLGVFDSGKITSQGHVTLGVSGEAFDRIRRVERIVVPPFEVSSGEEVIWIKPILVCTVKYMMRSASGGMRQPVFKGLRDDKRPEECVSRQDNI